MVYLQKYAREVVFASLILILYLLLRVPSILYLPIFTDEAIYIRWAQYLQTDLKFWDYALTDGKQPLFIWLISLFMNFTDNPLLAGRLVSVISGLLTTVGLFFLGREIFKNKWIGYASAFIYTVYPFALVYDRMALYDSLVGSFAVWGLYFVILFVRNVKLEYALSLGFVGGLGALNKSNGFFTIILLPISILLLDFKNKIFKINFLKWIVYSAITGVITYGMYSILRISPYFHIIEQKNAIFVYPFREWIQHPFTFFWGNLWVGQRDWFVKYFTYSFLVLVILSFFVNRKHLREKVLLVLWFLVPFLTLALFGRTIYPRYILFMTLSLLPMVAFSIYYITKKIKNLALSFILLTIIFSIPFWNDYLILYDYGKAPIPISDVSQYYTDWPSGYGIQETIKFLKETEKGKIALFTQGTFGLMPDAYLVYLHDDSQFNIEGVWPIPDQIPDKILVSASKMPTYIVFFQPCPNCQAKGIAPDSWQLKVALRIKKPAQDAWLTLYKVEDK